MAGRAGAGAASDRTGAPAHHCHGWHREPRPPAPRPRPSPPAGWPRRPHPRAAIGGRPPPPSVDPYLGRACGCGGSGSSPSLILRRATKLAGPSPTQWVSAEPGQPGHLPVAPVRGEGGEAMLGLLKPPHQGEHKQTDTRVIEERN